MEPKGIMRKLFQSRPMLFILGLFGIPVIYTALFQFFYVWMRYGVINAYPNVRSIWATYIANFVPLLLLWIVIFFIVFLIDVHSKKLWVHISIKLSASLGAVVAINLIFIHLTGKYVEWAGTIFNTFLIFLICEVVWYALARRLAEKEREEALNKLLDYRQNVVAAQFNPHFLFNSLNLLYSMIGDMPDETTKNYVLTLSKVYRYLLECQDMKIISLKKEIKFLEAYLEILFLRFGKKLIVEMCGEIPEQVGIIPFAMQLVVENAVKHNTGSIAHPLKIKITYNPEGITVVNNVSPTAKNDLGRKHQYGLNYLKDMYNLYHLTPMVSEDKNYFKVFLPLMILTS